MTDDEARPEIDWESVGEAIGAIQRTETGWMTGGGANVGARALEHVLGAQAIESTVQCAIDGGPGGDVALSVLLVLQPRAAMETCWRVYQGSDDDDEKDAAIEVLQRFCDLHALPWFDEILAQATRRNVRYLASMGVARIAEHGGLTAPEVEAWITRIAADPEPSVALAAKHVRDWGSHDGPHERGDFENAIAQLLLEEWAPSTGETGVGAEMESDTCAFLLAAMVRADPNTSVARIKGRLTAYRVQAMMPSRSPPDDETDARVAGLVYDLARSERRSP